MKPITSSIVLSAVLALSIPSEAAESTSVLVYRVTVVHGQTQAINYRYLKSSTMIDFKGTALLPQAQGRAKVKSKAGATEIAAKFENLSSPTQFGLEYLTYVLWAISPDGRPTNLGELIVKNGKSKLNVTASFQSFGLVVTAEPYFAVSEPSDVVVMENAVRKDTQGTVVSIEAKYDLLQRGQYQVDIAPSDLSMVMDKKTPLAVYEARNALRIARAARAQAYATDAFNSARELMTLTEAKGLSKKRRAAMAREVVQRAEDARFMSIKRQEAESLAGERRDSKFQLVIAKEAVTAAELGQSQAETAQAQAEFAQDRADAGRTAAEASNATFEQAKNRANAGRAVAEAAAATSEQARSRAAAERDAAVGQAKRSKGESAVLRAQLLLQLNSILQTRDSARGLIVNMSDVLFATGDADLQSAAREKLAKISGIVLSHPDLRFEVEGHTDSVGSDASNQMLSERRARGVLGYLVSQGVSADSIVARGFGSARPVASNDTAEGRQSNRRVELVMTGDSIQVSMNTAAPQ